MTNRIELPPDVERRLILQDVGLLLELLEVPRPETRVDYGGPLVNDAIVKLKVPQRFLIGVLHGRLYLRHVLADHDYEWRDGGVKFVPRWPKVTT